MRGLAVGFEDGDAPGEPFVGRFEPVATLHLAPEHVTGDELTAHEGLDETDQDRDAYDPATSRSDPLQRQHVTVTTERCTTA